MTRRKRRRWGILPAESVDSTGSANRDVGVESPGAAASLIQDDSAPLAPEPKVFKELLVNYEPHESRLAILEAGQLVEFYIEHDDEDQSAGNIYKGKVENVLPGMRAAFVNLGLEKNGFLYVDDAHAEERDHKRARPIQDVLKTGQDIVVQIVKEAIGNKGARVTTNISLPGRYLVLTPYSETIGVSRRIESERERERLRSIAERIRPKGMGLIVRTVADGSSQKALLRDLIYLRRMWTRIKHKARVMRSPALLHREASLIARTIRDHLDESVDRFVIDDEHAYHRAKEIADTISPSLKNRIEWDNGVIPLFELRGIEQELDRAVKRRVWLKCGGYLVIDETEALSVIDVNTGKNVGSTDLSDTVLSTNKEAAIEIARQLRLRDISGIIIVDFIDMENESDQAEVLKTLQKALRHDRTRVTVLGLTQLGLLEMTRKKVRESLLNQLTRVCPQCDGRGHVLSDEVIARRLRQRIIERLKESGAEALLVEANPAIASHLIGPGGTNLKELEHLTGRAVYVRGNDECAMEDIRFIQVGTREEVERLGIPVVEGQILEVLVQERHASNAKDGIARLEGYVLDIEAGGDRVGDNVRVEVVRALRTFATARIIPARDAERDQDLAQTLSFDSLPLTNEKSYSHMLPPAGSSGPEV